MTTIYEETLAEFPLPDPQDLLPLPSFADVPSEPSE